MRIISQDKKYDFPYDKIAIYVEDNFVMADLLNGCGDRVIAEYSSEENATIAVDTMRGMYSLSRIERKDRISDKYIDAIKKYCVVSHSPNFGILSSDFMFVFPKEKDLEGKK